MPEAIRFFFINSFLMYMRGPLKKAIAKISPIIEKVKNITNLAGTSTIVGSIMMLKNSISADTTSEIAALEYDLSLLRQLKIESHP